MATAVPTAYFFQHSFVPHCLFVPIVPHFAAAVAAPPAPAAARGVEQSCAQAFAAGSRPDAASTAKPAPSAPFAKLPVPDAASLAQCKDGLIAEHALQLAHDREGCHLVQQALDEAPSDDTRLQIMETLKGHVWELIRCPHANHVLQKLVIASKPSACQFVVDEILQQDGDAPVKLARHKYAYRVLQRMLEHLQVWQMAPVVACLAADSAGLSMNRYGTFVMQHVVEYATSTHQRLVVKHLVEHIDELSHNNDACMVLGAALASGDEEGQAVLGEAVIGAEGAIADMAHTRRGHVVVLSLLQVVGGPALNSALKQLIAKKLSLQKNRFGRLVLNSMHEQFGGAAAGAVGGA